MLGGGLVVMGLFLYMMYAGQEKKLRRIHQEKIASDMDRICVALILFYQEQGRYPSAEEGLDAVVVTRDSTAGGGGASEMGALEQIPLDKFARHAATLVAHCEPAEPLALCRRYTDVRVFSAGVEGVQKQVRDHLLHLLGVQRDRGKIRVERSLHLCTDRLP